MRQIKNKLLLAVLLLATSVSVSAGDLYFGAKTGKAILDDPAVKTDTTNTGIVVGWDQSVVLGDIGVEAEFTTTTGDGEYNTTPVTKFDFNTAAAYVAFRTAGPIYFKARGGVLRIDQEIAGQSGSDTGASYGIGLGFGIGIAQLELEYTQTSLDIDLSYVSVGIQF